MSQQRINYRPDMSGGVQSATSHFLKKVNEVDASYNAVYNQVIGAAKRRDGYEQVGKTIAHGKEGLYAGVYRYGLNNKIIVGINNDADTAATLRYLDGDNWTTILDTAAPNTYFNCLSHNEEFYVAGKSVNDVYMPITLIDQNLNTTTDYNVLNAPKARFITQFNGKLYAIDCEVDNVKYRNRAYFSSPPLGAITYIQTDQAGLLKQLRVDSVRYLKPGMVVDIYGAGTEARKVSSLTIISVDKKNNRISFADTRLDVSDNDEIWLTGRKNLLTYFWNTDFPTKQDADFFEISPSEETSTTPEFTAYGKNRGRLYLFTPDSFNKFDGSNLPSVSENVGCIAPNTVKNIGTWIIWFHSTGVWAFNDDTSQIRLLSKPVEKYIRAIKPANIPYITANVFNRVYKISIGEISDFEQPTTSTSTSSTSTSSTSSSTSSTSTSSTSTSSTSTSVSATTSTSTSSTSTSSTSSSTSSTSTSSTSTSTTTTASSKEVIRLCYDFDSNTWWVEKHRREHRFQFNHKMHGYRKPYFIDETGRLFRDETGDMDHFDTIPMEIEIGRDDMGYKFKKNFNTAIIDSDNGIGTKVMYSIDNGPFKYLGDIYGTVNEFDFGDVEGYDINYKFVHNNRGAAPTLNKPTTLWSALERRGDV